MLPLGRVSMLVAASTLSAMAAVTITAAIASSNVEILHIADMIPRGEDSERGSCDAIRSARIASMPRKMCTTSKRWRSFRNCD